MPIVNVTNLVFKPDPDDEIVPPSPLMDTPKPAPTAGETIGAWFKTDNVVGSQLAKTKIPVSTRKRGEFFNAFENLPEKYQDEESMKALAWAEDEHQRDAIMTQLDNERKNREIQAESGLGMNIVGATLATIIDPTTLIMGGPIGVAGKALKTSSALTKITTQAALASADQAVREGLLQTSQVARSAEESALNIAIAGGVGSLIGGAQAVLSPAPSSVLVDPVLDATGKEVAQPMVAGGSAAVHLDPTETAVVGGRAFDAFKRISPNARVAGATLPTARQEVESVFTNPFYTKGNEMGVPTAPSIENNVRQFRQQLQAKVMVASKDNYKTWVKDVKADPEQFADELINAGIKQASERQSIINSINNPMKTDLNRTNFGQLVHYAQWNGSPYQSVNESLSQLTEVVRKINGEARAAGIVVNSADEIPVTLNPKLVEADPVKFKRQVAAIVKDLLADIDPEDWDVQLGKSVPRDADPAQFADDLYDKIVRDQYTREMPWETSKMPIAFTEGLNEFLERDAFNTMQRTLLKAAPTIEFAKRGYTPSLKELKDSIHTQYTRAIEEATDPKVSKALRKEKDQMLADITTMGDRVFGRTHNGGNSPWATKYIAPTRTVMATVGLPNMVIASFVDIGRLYSVGGLKPLAKNLLQYFAPGNFSKMAKADAARIGHGLEDILNTRHLELNMLADLSGTSGPTRYQNAAAAGGEMLNKLSGMSKWNNMMKTLAGTLGSDRIMEGVAKYGKLKKKDIAWLAKNGIGEAEAKRMTAMFQKHGSVTDGYHSANVAHWDDQEIAKLYDSAIFKIANEVINTPTAGTLPTFMDNEAGRIFMQFKTFLYASHEQTLVAGMQAKDANVYMSLAVMVGIGALTGATLEWAKEGRDPFEEIAKDPADYASAMLGVGLDRSGVLSMLNEGMVVANKLSGGATPMFARQGEYKPNGDPVDLMAGPMGAYASRAYQVFNRAQRAATDENVNWRDSDTERLFKLIPLTSYYPAQPFLDPIKDAFDGIAESEVTGKVERNELYNWIAE